MTRTGESRAGAPQARLSLPEARRIGVEAYVYFYPLVLMELTRRQLTYGDPQAHPGAGPMGRFHHIRSFPAADFKAVVRPNFDTLYSSAWVDVAREPVVVSAPASDGRFFMLPCYDMWTDVFASPGTRTSGSEPFSFALTMPGWDGDLPEGVERIDAPTSTVWIIGRAQTDGPADYPAVRAFQDQLSIAPLSSLRGTPPAAEPVDAPPPGVDTTTPPLDQIAATSVADFFALAADIVRVHRPHLTDWGQIARMRRLGLTVGEPFDLGRQDPLVQEALADAPRRGRDELMQRYPRMAPVVNGWLHTTDTVGVYGDSYVRRAIIAMVGLGANHPEDAVYPVLQADADGKPLDGSNRYVIHFPADQLPPADAFWSVTMYDAHGFQAANALDRFAIGDRDALAYNADGSLDLFLQHDDPGPDKQSNWLPAPVGPLGVTMRLYLPRESVFTGAWTPPPVHQVA